jgi:hypothetical protein
VRVGTNPKSRVIGRETGERPPDEQEFVRFSAISSGFLAAWKPAGNERRSGELPVAGLQPLDVEYGYLQGEGVLGAPDSVASQPSGGAVSRDRRVETLFAETELVALREAAEREGLSLSALLRRCFLEWLQVDTINRRDEERVRREAERWHSRDPAAAREFFRRSHGGGSQQ